MLVLAHVSDTHLDGTETRRERTDRVFAYLNGLQTPVTAIVVTGDLADHGTRAEYTEVRAAFASARPVLTCPGNHDVRGPYRAVLLGDQPPGEPAESGPINRAYHVGGAVIAMCDSSIPGRGEGHLDDETLTWLTGILDSTGAGTPVFVAFHHPPVTLQTGFSGDTGQRGADRLERVLRRFPQLVAVLCGHTHTASATTFAGKPLRVAPGVASTLTLPWEHHAEHGLLDYDLPPGVAFHVFDGDGRFTTHLRAVP